ncbi:hypothetical protein BCS42_09325 [Crenothrix sp. D3]|jgi:hypothetical protein|nr:hypothetical protein BCS42_09325 [Crenothrix sp. D3]
MLTYSWALSLANRGKKRALFSPVYTGDDVQVVSYFAYFHDYMRENEHFDPKHGARGSQPSRAC